MQLLTSRLHCWTWKFNTMYLIYILQINILNTCKMQTAMTITISQGWKWEKSAGNGTFPFFPFPLCLFPVSGDRLQIQLEGLGSNASYPKWSGWNPAERRFLVHSQLNIMLPVRVLLQKFADNQVCIAAQWHTGMVTRCGKKVVVCFGATFSTC